MNIHEYQAKDLLRAFGLPVLGGTAVADGSEARAAAAKLPGPVYVVKSQITAGGRGKGRFKELGADAQGGVRFAASIDEVGRHAEEMLGNTLVTSQTGPAGQRVDLIYVEDGAEITRELYLSAMIDPADGCVAFVASRDGGVDIEQMQREAPESIVGIGTDSGAGFLPHHGRAVARALGLSGALGLQAEDLAAKLYAAFVAKDMAMVEINPLIVSRAGLLCCLDAKVRFDPNALFRHPDIAALGAVGHGLARKAAQAAVLPSQRLSHAS